MAPSRMEEGETERQLICNAIQNAVGTTLKMWGKQGGNYCKKRNSTSFVAYTQAERRDLASAYRTVWNAITAYPFPALLPDSNTVQYDRMLAACIYTAGTYCRGTASLFLDRQSKLENFFLNQCNNFYTFHNL